jgi:hypothetical protein
MQTRLRIHGSRYHLTISLCNTNTHTWACHAHLQQGYLHLALVHCKLTHHGHGGSWLAAVWVLTISQKRASLTVS